MSRKKSCSCELCRLSRCLTRINKKLKPPEQACLNTLWDRMECAEQELDMLKFAAEEDGRVEILGVLFERVAKEKMKEP